MGKSFLAFVFVCVTLRNVDCFTCYSCDNCPEPFNETEAVLEKCQWPEFEVKIASGPMIFPAECIKIVTENGTSRDCVPKIPGVDVCTVLDSFSEHEIDCYICGEDACNESAILKNSISLILLGVISSYTFNKIINY